MGEKYNLDPTELKRMLMDFDKETGSYPEHEYEGGSLWRFFQTGETFGGSTDEWNEEMIKHDIEYDEKQKNSPQSG